MLPDLDNKPVSEKTAHAYVVTDYSLEHKAVKLYDLRARPNSLPEFTTNLLLSITERADPNKEELWINLKKEKYASFICIQKISTVQFFKINRNLKQISYNKHYSKVKYAYEVDIKQASTFMINMSLFSHLAEVLALNVFTADNEKQIVEFSNEMPHPQFHNRT